MIEKKSLSPTADKAVAVDDGKRLLYPFLAAGGVGLGAAGLNALVRRLAGRQRKQVEKKHDNLSLNALYDDAANPTIKTSGDNAYTSLLEYIGRLMPRGLPATASGDGDTGTVSPTHWAARTVLPVAAGAAGLGLGYGGASNYFRGREKKKNMTSAVSDVDAARKEYFDSLLGSKQGAALEQLYTEKDAFLFGKPGERGQIGKLWNMVGGLPLAAAMGMGAVGAGYGGMLSYKKRKEEGEEASNRRAIAARNRLRGITPPLISPKEIDVLRNHLRAKKDV